ncbi:ABC transporter permease [Desulfosporosinus hippei]|uniref:Putative spermidine/putrescine transport system permease protein n=1 Tax=Desulfosporosinus hippei DSM 8344 TaxID=1121419 RepID=A0A1G7UPJ3_9FIRM|nr:ABC transporter permease subunit [Desulfosporosinus hippei]SDG49426.1 putative spermidine/putrescine transport system permease protein [Desulfosporosinus hippei DSM 8344]
MKNNPVTQLGQELRRGGILWVPFIPLIVFALAFEILPMGYIIYSSIHNSEGLNFQSYTQIFHSKYYVISLKNSLLVSVAVGIIGLFIGTAGALALRSVGEAWREKLLTLVNMTSNFSGVPLAFAYIVLLGVNGLVTVLMKEKMGLDLYGTGFNLFSWTGIVLVYIYFSVPLAFMLMYPAVYALRQDIQEAAQILGASRFHFWRKIGLPILLPSMLGSFTLLFANSLGAYATAYALTNSNNSLVSITIANLVTGDIFPEPSLASALAVIMAGFLVVSIIINEKLKKQGGGIGQ